MSPMNDVNEKLKLLSPNEFPPLLKEIPGQPQHGRPLQSDINNRGEGKIGEPHHGATRRRFQSRRTRSAWLDLQRGEPRHASIPATWCDRDHVAARHLAGTRDHCARYEPNSS